MCFIYLFTNYEVANFFPNSNVKIKVNNRYQILFKLLAVMSEKSFAGKQNIGKETGQ